MWVPPARKSPRSSFRIAAPVAVVVAGALSLAGCGGSPSSDSQPGAGGSPSAAASSGSGPSTVSVVLTNDGCTPSASSVRSGPMTFKVTNQNATAVSELELLSGERIVGEKENLAPGFSGSFSLDLDAGTYSLYCPGASTQNTTFTVTGQKAATADDGPAKVLKVGTTEYAGYINSQVAILVATVKPLVAAIDAGNVAAAQQAYAKSRPYYERVEPVAESFTVGSNNLDADIDARINDVPLSKWEGFHRIERALFTDHTTKGMKGYAAGLQANVEKLQQKTAHLSYQPAELANGAVSLLDEVAKSKITGEEERYSHIDVLDMEANVEGSEQAFADIEPALKKIDPQLAATVAKRFTALTTLLSHYRDTHALGGFVRYNKLSNRDIHLLSQSVEAVSEPLSQVAGKIVGA
jgi:iron uptake system component EfeO